MTSVVAIDGGAAVRAKEHIEAAPREHRKAIRELERAKALLRAAQDGLAAAVQAAYPVGCMVRYTTNAYDVVYQVIAHNDYGTRIKVKRAFIGNKHATERWLDADSSMVEFYRLATARASARSCRKKVPSGVGIGR